jgi:hypothetical protein
MTDQQLQYAAHELRGRIHLALEPLLKEFGEKTGQAPQVELEYLWGYGVDCTGTLPTQVRAWLRQLSVHVGVRLNGAGPPSVKTYWATSE